jgi:4-oxalocrotonate tautomerase
MPHVIVKLLAGRSEHQKARLAEDVSRAVVTALDSDDSSVSVAIEEVQASDWTEKVYKPDIIGNMDRVYKKPGYNPV